MTLPAPVYQLLHTFAAAFPLPQGTPGEAHDERCRQWVTRFAEQVKHDFPDSDGRSYGVKRADPHRPISKDSLAQAFVRSGVVDGLWSWDLLSGAGTGSPTISPDPAFHNLFPDEAGNYQVFVPVAAVNHLGVGPTPEPPPSPSPPSDPTLPCRYDAVAISDLRAEVSAARVDLVALASAVNALAARVDALVTKPAPIYDGSARFIGKVTLTPRD